MADSPSTYVLDANILIGLYVVGLSREVSRLPFRLVASGVTLVGLEDPRQGGQRGGSRIGCR